MQLGENKQKLAHISLSHYHIISATVKNLHDQKSHECSGQKFRTENKLFESLHLNTFYQNLLLDSGFIFILSQVKMS